MEAGTISAGGGRPALGRPSLSRLPDRVLRWGLTGLAAAILALIAYFFVKLTSESSTAFDRFGVFGFGLRMSFT